MKDPRGLLGGEFGPDEEKMQPWRQAPHLHPDKCCQHSGGQPNLRGSCRGHLQWRLRQTATAGFYLDAEDLTAETFLLPKELELSVGSGRSPKKAEAQSTGLRTLCVKKRMFKIPSQSQTWCREKNLLKMIKECSEAQLFDSLVG